MAQLSSVERTTLIELFSTFFDRVSSNHPQREAFIKQLYTFKTHLYANDPMDQYFKELYTSLHDPKNLKSEQKSDFKRDHSSSRLQQRSLKKDEINKSVREDYISRIQKTNDEQFHSSANRQLSCFKDQKNLIFTSCNHEVDKEAFLILVHQQLSELNQVRCPTCNSTLPSSDYKHLTQINSFEEFKQKHIQLLKFLNGIEKSNEEFTQLITQFEIEEKRKSRENSLSPSKLFSGLYKEERLASGNLVTKRCLRCNKEFTNDQKNQISCFCPSCKNF